MAWKEMSGTRKINMHGVGPGPHSVDFIISFVGIEGTDNLAAGMPINGDSLSDVKGSGSLDSSFGSITFHAEPTIADASESHKLTENQCMVTCRFRGWIVE